MGEQFNENAVQNLKRALLDLKPNDDVARIELNKRLIERYPFLELKGWAKSEHRYFNSTWLDNMPAGWKKTLGIPLCEELREELLRIDPFLLNTYRVSQVKEKYGTLRWYDDMSYSEKMEDIITKYEDISAYTCVSCGKINVPIYDDGWISPYCIACFKKHMERFRNEKLNDEQAEYYISSKACLSRDTIITSRDKNGEKKRRVDFSDTLRNLGVDPDSLPMIEEIIMQRKSEEKKDRVNCKNDPLYKRLQDMTLDELLRELKTATEQFDDEFPKMKDNEENASDD